MRTLVGTQCACMPKTAQAPSLLRAPLAWLGPGSVQSTPTSLLLLLQISSTWQQALSACLNHTTNKHSRPHRGLTAEHASDLREQNQEHHQQGEKRNRLSQGKAQQSIADQLLGDVGVAGSTVDQGPEHHAQTSAHASQSNGSAASANHLGGSQDAHVAHWEGGRLVRGVGSGAIGTDGASDAAGVQAEHGGHLLRKRGVVGQVGVSGVQALGPTVHVCKSGSMHKPNMDPV